MFLFSSQKGKFPRVKRLLPVFFSLTLVFGFLLSACDLDDGGGDDGGEPFVDNHELNPGLVGTWKVSGEGWADTYTITTATLGHSTFLAGSETGYAGAAIGYVYNFSGNAGCLIIKLEEGKFTAVYFKNLTSNTVLLGEAYDTAIPYPGENDPSVATLEDAKERFKPANAELYGGGTAQTGTPQTRQ